MLSHRLKLRISGYKRRKIKLIEDNFKMSSSKKVDLKGTFRQVSHVVIFAPAHTLKVRISGYRRRKIRLIEGNAKCRHLKKWICKGTLRLVFIRIYGLEIQSVMLVFSTQPCKLLPF
jgi:hypothetical protein